jgi:undecaprenyl diphosphate synthase
MTIHNNQNSPNHIAFIMDGNGRWAESRGLNRIEGHRKGIEHIEQLLTLLSNKGVKYVTLYAFSTENWARPKSEVNGIFKLLRAALSKQLDTLSKSNIKLKHIGSKNGLSKSTQLALDKAINATKNNNGMTLVIAINYGGRSEIIEAVKKIMQTELDYKDINESTLSSYLQTSTIPDPDLIIRTGGEFRTSNFLIWQSAYSEYYISNTLWPDFSIDDVEMAIEAYRNRERRFGNITKNDPNEN